MCLHFHVHICIGLMYLEIHMYPHVYVAHIYVCIHVSKIGIYSWHWVTLSEAHEESSLQFLWLKGPS